MSGSTLPSPPPRRIGKPLPSPVAGAGSAAVDQAGARPNPARLVPLAAVARPHGVRGELRLKLHNRDSDLLLGRREVVLRYPDGEERLVVMKSVRRANEAMLVQLEGCGDRDAADELRNAQVLVPRDAFPAPDEGEYYACDLVGLRVVDAEGEVGRVHEFVSYPTCDALLITAPSGAFEVPLVDDIVDSIDLERGEVRIFARAALAPP